MKMRIFNYWDKYVTLAGIFLFLLVCGSLLLFMRFIPPSLGADAPDTEITIIPVSTYTHTPTTDQLEAKITPSATPIQMDGLQIGQYVQITGTGGSGLRIRSEPGLTTSVNFIGLDNEVFLIQDGPVQEDDYTWWYIEAPYDQTRNGWAASNYLSLIAQ